MYGYCGYPFKAFNQKNLAALPILITKNLQTSWWFTDNHHLLINIIMIFIDKRKKNGANQTRINIYRLFLANQWLYPDHRPESQYWFEAFSRSRSSCVVRLYLLVVRFVCFACILTVYWGWSNYFCIKAIYHELERLFLTIIFIRSLKESGFSYLPHTKHTHAQYISNSHTGNVHLFRYFKALKLSSLFNLTSCSEDFQHWAGRVLNATTPKTCLTTFKLAAVF